MVPLSLPQTNKPTPVVGRDTAAVGYLNHLRFVEMKCRVKPRTDLFKACAMLHADPTASTQAYAEALMRCLTEALGKPARLLAPGVSERTFDEDWLVQLGRASGRGDEASLAFLLASRVRPEHRRLVRFLVRQISNNFGLT